MKKALIQLHLAVFLWGFTGVLGKAIELDAPVLVWYRMLISAAMFLVVLGYRKEFRRLDLRSFLQLSGIGALIALHWVAFYASIQFANVSIALVCLSTASVFTALLEPLVSKKKFNWLEIGLSLLAIAGVYSIYHFQQFYGKGILWGVIAAMLSAVFTVFNKKVVDRFPARTVAGYEIGFGFLFLCCVAPFFLGANPGIKLTPTPSDWLWLGILSLACTVWAQSLSLSALKKVSSFTVTLSVNLEPVYGILLACIVFAENKQLNMGFYLGMALIIASVLLHIAFMSRKSKRDAEAELLNTP